MATYCGGKPGSSLHLLVQKWEPLSIIVSKGLRLISYLSLTHKLVMLLALTTPSRLPDLTSPDLDLRHFSPEGVAHLLAKQGRSLIFSLPLIHMHEDLCLLSCVYPLSI